MPRSTFRFAPSPNGDLHLGHALSAALNQRMARAEGGRFLVRIEDVDPTRARPEIAARQLDDLAWLGIVPDEPPVWQSARAGLYEAALARLSAMGLVYPCRRPRAALTAEAGGRTDPDGGAFVVRAPGADAGAGMAALRLDMAAAARLAGPLSWHELGSERRSADPAPWGDVVLRRRDGGAAYHLAVVVDDAAQGVTHVVRGRDLEGQTAIHRLLQALLGLPEPALYHHHRLILDAQGRKLSKSEGAATLVARRAAGATHCYV